MYKTRLAGWQEGSNYVAIDTGLRHLPIGHCQSTTGLTLCQSYITGSNFQTPPGCSCSSLKKKIFILEILSFHEHYILYQVIFLKEKHIWYI